MLSLFRTNQFVSNILLLFYVLLLRGLVFFVPMPEVEMARPSILSKWVYEWIGSTGFLPDMVAMILVLLQALLVNVIVAKYRMAQTVSLYPGLFYIMLMSCFPEFLHLSPVLMSNTFVLMALYELYDTYKKYSAAGKLYNVGLWLGVGAMFYYSTLVYVPIVILSLQVIRSFRLKETMIVLMGLLTPYWLLGVGYYFVGQEVEFWRNAFHGNMGHQVIALPDQIVTYVRVGLFAILFLWALLSYNYYAHKINFRANINLTILYFLLAAPFLSLFVQGGIAYDHLLMFVVPLSIMLSMTMLYMNDRLAEAIHFLALVAILLYQTMGWWNA